jgi:hypothetical protein
MSEVSAVPYDVSGNEERDEVEECDGSAKWMVETEDDDDEEDKGMVSN